MLNSKYFTEAETTVSATGKALQIKIYLMNKRKTISNIQLLEWITLENF